MPCPLVINSNDGLKQEQLETYISTIRMSMASKLDREVNFHEGSPSTTRMSMASKLDREVNFHEGSPSTTRMSMASKIDGEVNFHEGSPPLKSIDSVKKSGKLNLL